MNVRQKLLVLIAFVAVVPLAVSAFQSLRIHQSALEQAHTELHANSANFSATLVSDRLTAAQAGFGALAQDSVNWASLSEDERNGAIWLIYAVPKSCAHPRQAA